MAQQHGSVPTASGMLAEAVRRLEKPMGRADGGRAATWDFSWGGLRPSDLSMFGRPHHDDMDYLSPWRTPFEVYQIISKCLHDN